MATTQPELPQAAHADLDSMLSRKFGREVANYFSGSPVNRVSFLRADNQFLTKAFTQPSTRFLLFNNLAPLGHNMQSMYYGRRSEITSLVGENPWAKPEKQLIEEYNSNITTPQMIFLGLDERTQAKTERVGDKQDDGEGFEWKEVYKGAPLFAVDVTPKGTIAEKCETLIKEMTDKKLEFLEGNRRMILSLPAEEAAIYGQARAMLDWNARNPFCGGCGQPTLSLNAGGKRTCPPTDLARLGSTALGNTSGEAPSSAREPCVTRKGISNLCYPRTDPSIIVAVLSHDGHRIMLGRQKRWPPHWYSTLAGFVEPAESIEEAVRREVWEESGVTLGRVIIHSTQPWPFPANLMIGAIGQAVPDEGEKINLGNDPELEDARWFSFEEVREALRTGTSGIGEPPLPGYKEGSLRLPPRTAIANQLIQALVDGFAGKESML